MNRFVAKTFVLGLFIFFLASGFVPAIAQQPPPENQAPRTGSGPGWDAFQNFKQKLNGVSINFIQQNTSTQFSTDRYTFKPNKKISFSWDNGNYRESLVFNQDVEYVINVTTYNTAPHAVNVITLRRPSSEGGLINLFNAVKDKTSTWGEVWNDTIGVSCGTDFLCHLMGFLAEVINVFAGLFTTLIGLFIGLSLSFINWTLDLNTTVANDNMINQGVLFVRDLANAVLIIGLIVIALGIMVQSNKYGKGLLKTFIVIALLINFAVPIGRFIIEVGNQLNNQFKTAIQNAKPTEALSKMLSADILREEAEKNEFIKKTTGNNATGLERAKNALIRVVFIILFGLVSIVVFITIFIILFIRYVALNVLLILAPLGFALGVLPITRPYAEKWWSQFIRWVFVGPILLMFLYITFSLINSLAIEGQNLNNQPGVQQVAKHEIMGGQTQDIIFSGTILFTPNNQPAQNLPGACLNCIQIYQNANHCLTIYPNEQWRCMLQINAAESCNLVVKAAGGWDNYCKTSQPSIQQGGGSGATDEIPEGSPFVDNQQKNAVMNNTITGNLGLLLLVLGFLVGGLVVANAIGIGIAGAAIAQMKNFAKSFKSGLTGEKTLSGTVAAWGKNAGTGIAGGVARIPGLNRISSMFSNSVNQIRTARLKERQDRVQKGIAATADNRSWGQRIGEEGVLAGSFSTLKAALDKPRSFGKKKYMQEGADQILARMEAGELTRQQVMEASEAQGGWFGAGRHNRAVYASALEKYDKKIGGAQRVHNAQANLDQADQNISAAKKTYGATTGKSIPTDLLATKTQIQDTLRTIKLLDVDIQTQPRGSNALRSAITQKQQLTKELASLQALETAFTEQIKAEARLNDAKVEIPRTLRVVGKWNVVMAQNADNEEKRARQRASKLEKAKMEKILHALLHPESAKSTTAKSDETAKKDDHHTT